MIQDLSAQKYAGVSAYAGMSPRFDSVTFLKCFEMVNNPAIALVWGTFGECTNLIRDFCDLSHRIPHLLEIHLSNEVGRRNGRLYEGELCSGLGCADYSLAIRRGNHHTVAAIERRLSLIRETCAKYCNVNTRVVISTGLEDQLEAASVLALMDIIRKVWARVEIVRSPVNNGGANPWLLPYPIEVHTRSAGVNHAFFNFDGTSIPESINSTEALKTMRNHRSSVCRFLWSAPMQGIYSTTLLSPPPRKRKFTVDPMTVRLFNRILRGL